MATETAIGVRATPAGPQLRAASHRTVGGGAGLAGANLRPGPRVVRPLPNPGRAPSQSALILAALFLLSTAAFALSAVPVISSGETYLFPPPSDAVPLVTSGSNVYFAGAQASTQICGTTCTYVTNSGVRTTIQVVGQTVTGCLSYWIGDDSAANIWGQVGYYICNGSTIVAFYQIWNLSTGAALASGTTSVSVGYHTFSMYSQAGGNVWAFALDGTAFGTYDMGASLSLGTYPVQAVSEEGLVSGPWTPAQVSFSTAIQTLQTASTSPAGSGWASPASAYEPWGGCTSSGSANNTGGYTCWGVAGNLQNPSIPVDALVTGGTIPALRSGASLWSGVAPDFALSANPTSVAVGLGASGTSTIAVDGVNGFAGTVALAWSVSPTSGLSCTLNPTSVMGSGTSTLSCSGTAPGTYAVSVTGTSGPLSHSASATFTVGGSVVLTLSYAVLGGGTGYAAPTLTYVEAGGTKTATLATSAAAYTVDGGSAWSVTNPLSGSSTAQRWQTAQATSGAATASVTIVFSYSRQFSVTFAYAVSGGGTGSAGPTVAYASFGSAASTATGSAVWADAGSMFQYPTSLPGSSSTEAWRTNAAAGTVTASGTVAATFYHEFLVTFEFTVQGGGSGYSAPVVATVQFGASASFATGVATWADAGASFTFPNPLDGSTASERWLTTAATGIVAAAGAPTATYVHQVSVTFAYAVIGGSGYAAPNASFTDLGTPSTAPMGLAVWADASTPYGFTNPLGGSTSTAAWRTGSAGGTVSTAGTIAATYYYQFLVGFLVQVLNGPAPPTMPTLTVTQYGATAPIAAGGSSWVDANGSYAYPASFAGGSGERWLSGSPSAGVVTLPGTMTASYYHQYAVTFAFTVSGGGNGYAAPSVTYAALGSPAATSAGTTAWADAGSAFSYGAMLSGSSAAERWLTAAPGGTVTAAGTVTVTYVHQFWTDFAYVVKGGGTGYSAPSVTYSNLSSPRSVPAAGVGVWADAGVSYAYQNPLPGSTSTNSWQTNNGVGTVAASTTYSATYRHQFKVKFRATTATGAPTPEAPLVNVTVFGYNVSLPADNVSWVDAGSSYAFPGVFYGPLPGERWITSTPPEGVVLGPMNITADYVHQYYLLIQVNAPAGGSVAGSPGWYNETTALVLRATARPGWEFQGWVGSGTGSYTGSSATAAIAMDAPVTETAVFYVGLTLTANDGGSLRYAFGGTGGWVPAGTSQTVYVAPGTQVTVTASPSLFYALDGWSGGASGTPSTVVLVANAPSTLTATFALTPFSVVSSPLALAILVASALVLVLAVRRHRRKKKALRLRMARMRARAQAQGER